MNRFYVIILTMVITLMSCDKTNTENKVSYDDPLQYMIGDWCLFNHDDVLKVGDSVLVFSEQGRFGNINTLVIRPANKTRYNATYYQGDSLNVVYNEKRIDDIPGPKFFFEAVAFRVELTNFNRITKKLDELLDRTGAEGHVDMIDGNVSFVGSYNGKTRKVNDGAGLNEWKVYSTFLQDSVIRPFQELREKGRREVESDRLR